jgi:hypothetical protein
LVSSTRKSSRWPQLALVTRTRSPKPVFASHAQYYNEINEKRVGNVDTAHFINPPPTPAVSVQVIFLRVRRVADVIFGLVPRRTDNANTMHRHVLWIRVFIRTYCTDRRVQ